LRGASEAGGGERGEGGAFEVTRGAERLRDGDLKNARNCGVGSVGGNEGGGAFRGREEEEVRVRWREGGGVTRQRNFGVFPTIRVF